MPGRGRKAPQTRPPTDLAAVGPTEASELLASALVADPRSGVLRLSNEPCMIIRPEIIAGIQKQLEQTIGGSAKGIMYLSGERSSVAGLSPLESLTPRDRPLTLERAKQVVDASALLGWGRTEIVHFDLEQGQFTVAVQNSPVAVAYGSAKKPVCHFLAGWIAGVCRLVVGKELLCEETACKVQGRERCEFELRPMPTL